MILKIIKIMIMIMIMIIIFKMITMMIRMKVNLRTRLVMMCLLLVCSAVRKRGEGGRDWVGGKSNINSSRDPSSSSATRGID